MKENLWIGQPKHAKAKNVLLWNLVLDETFGPNLAQNCESGKFCGCSDCRGLLTLLADGTWVTNIDYFGVKHSSAFVKPGYRLIETETTNG